MRRKIGFVCLFVFVLMSGTKIAMSEEKVLFIGKEGLLKNGIVAEEPKLVVHQRKVRTYGLIIEELSTEKEAVIEVKLPRGRHLDSAPKIATVPLEDGTELVAELADQKGKFLYRVSKEPLDRIVVSDLVPISLPAGSPVEGVVLSPSSIVWWEGKAWVYLGKDSEHFVRREVPTYIAAKDGWFVPKNFMPEKEKLVLQGAESLLSQEFIGQSRAEDE